MDYAYPVRFFAADGRIQVRFPDVPEALTEGDDPIPGDGAPADAGDGERRRAAGGVAKRTIVTAWRAMVRRASRPAGAFPAQRNRLADCRAERESGALSGRGDLRRMGCAGRQLHEDSQRRNPGREWPAQDRKQPAASSIPRPVLRHQLVPSLLHASPRPASS